MKREVIAVAAALSLAFAVPAFAIEDTHPAEATAQTFEQMKADHLKRLDDRMNSLQQEKACSQAATSQDDLKACRAKHKEEMKDFFDKMRKRGNPGGQGGQVPPQ
jgi:hypothetical protein